MRGGLVAILLLIPPPMPSAATMKKRNHLAKEKSPYLLQHADNPVDWHPWGEEAFAKARKEDKPILLSIGYSTCHWCHVMERESFSNPEIAALMNAHFVNIKLDREERPDVDKIYMTAVQAMTGSGGWPLNVFLTPELKPFFGGTYFPPSARWGQPGFPQLLERIAELWKTKRATLDADSRRLAEAIGEATRAGGAKTSAPGRLDAALLENAYKSYKGSFDPDHGGFGGAPKFPLPVHQNFLLSYWASRGEKDAKQMALDTLRAMSRGGIYDHVGGGFHRYSTDAQWRVPHFEKMLYDNAQLAVNFLDAYQISGDQAFEHTARETLDYILRDMTHPAGGFYSAEDADSLPPELVPLGEAKDGHAEKSEGAFYLWRLEELKDLLGPDAELFARRYGALKDGNAPADPHGEFTGKNILYAASSLEDSARGLSLAPGEAARKLESARAKLLEIRGHRPRPGLDDKILASWNGLMISALAKGASILDEPRYRVAALKAARFLKDKLYDPKTRRLHHRWRDDQPAVGGMADDYAFLVMGLLDLYESSFELEWLAWAEELTDVLLGLFSGPEGGLFMTAEGHDKNLLVRVMEDYDNVEPSANSVAVLNLLRLAGFTGRKEYREFAEKTLNRFAPALRDRPLSMPQMLAAAAMSLQKGRQIVIAADSVSSPGVSDMLQVLSRRFLPNKIVLLATPNTREALGPRLAFLRTAKPKDGKATAYVCVDFVCRLPTTDLKTFEEQLR